MNADLVLLGLVIALEPLPLTGYILLLSTTNGTRKGLAYLVGWVLTLVLMVVLTELLTGGKPIEQHSQPSTAADLIKIAMGLLLLAVAWRVYSHRGHPARRPSWMSKLDQASPAVAMSLGFLLQPWPLVIAGAASILSADLAKPATIAALVLFCVLSSASYLIMQVYVVASPDSARARLGRLRVYLDTHRDRIVIVLSLGIGLWLIAENLYLLLR
jgi:hypothetical protein